MTATLIDGKAFAATLRARIATEVAQMKDHGITPGLAVVLVGEDPASQVYVRSKGKMTREVGMKIAKVLTEAHQGSIDAHSDGENSNIVRINLPASRLSFFEPEPRTPQPAAKAQDKRLAEISAALAQDPRVRFAKADAPAMAARQLSEDKAAVRDRIPPHSNPG